MLAANQGLTNLQADQWRIRSELRARFPDKPWVDVLSKADLLQAVFDAAAMPGDAWAEGEPPVDGARVRAAASSHAAEGCSGSELSAHCAADAEPGSSTGCGPGMAGAMFERAGTSEAAGSPGTSASSSAADPAEQPEAGGAPVADPGLAGNPKRGPQKPARGFSWGAAGDTRGAAEVARALPEATRVSAVTGCGLEALQAAVLGLMAPDPAPEAQPQSVRGDEGESADVASGAVSAGGVHEGAGPGSAGLKGQGAVLLSSAG